MLMQQNVTDDGSHVVPEPLPDWPDAIQTWGLAWKVHVYGFGALYILLCLSTFYFMIKLRKRLLPQPYVLAIAFFVVLLSVCRIVYILIDPYQSRDILPPLLVRMLNALVYPCIVAMFTLLHVIIVRITKFNPDRAKAVKTHRMLCVFITAYFVCAGTITAVVSWNVRLKFLILFSQGVFISWGLVVCFSFVYNGFKVAQFTSEANRALKEFTLYTKIRKEAMKNGKTGDLALHRVTKPRMRDEAEMLPMELEASCESGGDSSDSISFFNEAFGENEKCEITIRPDEPDWGRKHSNCTDEHAQVDTGNDSVVTSVSQLPASGPDSSEMETDERTESPSPIPRDSVSTDQRPVTRRHKTPSNRKRPRRDATLRDTNVSSHHHRNHPKKKTLSLLASYFKSNGVLHAKEPSVGRWEPGQALFCHTNRAFDVGSCHSSVTNLDIDPTSENIPFVKPTGDPCTTVTHHVDRPSNDTVIYTSAITPHIDIGDGGYMADTEPNSPKLNMCTRGKGGRPKPPNSLPLDVESQHGSPRHAPYPLPLNDGSMGLYRILQGRVLGQVHRVVYFATLFVFITCIMKLYAMFGVYGVLTKDTKAEMWPWYVFNTCARLSELGAAFSISWVTFTLSKKRWRMRRKRKLKTKQMTTC